MHVTSTCKHLPVCPVACGGRCAASRYDGVWTPPRTQDLCQPAAASGTSWWCTGSPTECGSQGWGSPSTEVARTASPEEETKMYAWGRGGGEVKKKGSVDCAIADRDVNGWLLLLCHTQWGRIVMQFFTTFLSHTCARRADDSASTLFGKWQRGWAWQVATEIDMNEFIHPLSESVLQQWKQICLSTATTSNSYVFPSQLREIISPASLSTLGPPPGRTNWKHLTQQVPRRHPDQMPELNLLVPFDVCFEPQAPHLIPKEEPRYPLEKTYFICLHLQSNSFD